MELRLLAPAAPQPDGGTRLEHRLAPLALGIGVGIATARGPGRYLDETIALVLACVATNEERDAPAQRPSTSRRARGGG